MNGGNVAHMSLRGIFFVIKIDPFTVEWSYLLPMNKCYMDNFLWTFLNGYMRQRRKDNKILWKTSKLPMYIVHTTNVFACISKLNKCFSVSKQAQAEYAWRLHIHIAFQNMMQSYNLFINVNWSLNKLHETQSILVSFERKVIMWDELISYLQATRE